MLWGKRKKTEDRLAEQRQVLDAMLAFSQTQILAQVTDEASLDSRTIGLLAFNGALLGGTLAAKALLGYYWWALLIVVALATGPCLWSVFKKGAFGPPALAFYKEFGAQGPLNVRTQLLADLDDTFDFNAGRVRWKTLRPRPDSGQPVPVPPPSGLPLVGAGGVVRSGNKRAWL